MWHRQERVEVSDIRAYGILLAIVAGLLLGIASASVGGGWVDRAIAIADSVGGMWLNALRMTVIPLVVSLLITGGS